MNSSDISDGLSVGIPAELATDVVAHFVAIKADVATDTLERASPGKFVETVVQILQFLDNSRYQANPKVDDYLKNLESRAVNLSDDLRITLSRVARSMYTIRNKRNIAHKGAIDPSVGDLWYLLASAQWVLSELVRTILSTDMDTASRLVQFIQKPIDQVVEDFGEKRLVLRELTAKDELLVLLRYYYPDTVKVSQIHMDMDRLSRPTVSNTLKAARKDRLIEGNPGGSYKLTALGYRYSTDVVSESLAVD